MVANIEPSTCIELAMVTAGVMRNWMSVRQEQQHHFPRRLQHSFSNASRPALYTRHVSHFYHLTERMLLHSRKIKGRFRRRRGKWETPSYVRTLLKIVSFLLGYQRILLWIRPRLLFSLPIDRCSSTYSAGPINLAK